MFEEYSVVKDLLWGDYAVIRSRYSIASNGARTHGREIVKDNMTYNEACGSLKKFYTE